MAHKEIVHISSPLTVTTAILEFIVHDIIHSYQHDVPLICLC